MFVKLSQDWKGRAVVLVGGGPSLRGFCFDSLRQLQGGGVLVVAINDAMRHCRFADVVFSIDRVWLGRRRRLLATFPQEKLAAADARCQQCSGIRYVRRCSEARLSDDPGLICTGENSGFAALGMAMMRGASDVALLGFDMSGPGHFHGGYEWRCPHGVADYPRWADHFAVLADEATRRGTNIVNCNPRSAVRCFRFATLAEFVGATFQECAA